MFVCAECGASQQEPGPCPADASPMQPIGDDALLGTTIGPYRVARLLGIGGMGRVYKGVHPQIGSRVAIKVLSRECSDRRDLVDRFFSEAKAVNLIRHESIVNVLDLAMLPDGRPYIVMEYLDGSPLSGIIDHAKQTGTRLPIGGVARLTAEVLDALGAAHGKGIVHRDLKPDNIYVTPAGRAKVLDFGIAKLQPELGGSATHTGSLLGTPHYMSPEQAAGRSVDLRADIYAIGVILFECLTLQRPFSADALFDLLRMHIEATPPSARALRPDLPLPVEQIIYQALAKPPEHRFASAQAMSMALQQATAQLPPEEWAPLVGGKSPPTGGGWQPTPPASWAKSNSKRVSHAVGPAAARSSKKGLWIGLAAVLLVGGGIAAIALSRGDSKADDKTKVADTDSDPVVPPVQVPTDVPTKPPVHDPDDDNDADDHDADAHTAAPHQRAKPAGDDDDDPAMEATLAGLFDNMPAAQRKMLPKEVQALLKKYGSWSKVPKAQRDKLDPASLMAQLATSLDDLDGTTDDPPPAKEHQKDAAKTADATKPPAQVEGTGPDGWVISREFAGPSWFDPAKVDGTKAQAWAIAEAKRLVPDAVLFRVDADGVMQDGHANLTLKDGASLDYRFISAAHAKLAPVRGHGVPPADQKCEFRIELTKDGAWSTPLTAFKCDDKPIGPSKCTFAQVWKKGLAMKAPGNGIGELGYRAFNGGEPRWYFDVKDDTGAKLFSDVFQDICN